MAIVDLQKLASKVLEKNKLPTMPERILEGLRQQYTQKMNGYGFDFENERLANAIATYLSRMYANGDEYQKPSKGLMLAGTPGTGKTFALQLLSGFMKIECQTAAELARKFSIGGDKGFWDYVHDFRNIPLIIDDIGAERETTHYGNAGVVGEYLTTRYEMWRYDGILTFMSTNLATDKFIGRYGERNWSRINEMATVLFVKGRDRRIKTTA